MAARLSGLASRLWSMRDAQTLPVAAATLFLIDGEPDDFFATAVDAIERSLPLVPRYRQLVTEIPGALGRPVWTDFADFDVAEHVRRVVLPPAAAWEEVWHAATRVVNRPFDTSRPMWDVHLFSAGPHGQNALLIRSHAILVDSRQNRDLADVLACSPAEDSGDMWVPQPVASKSVLVLDALADHVFHPLRSLSFSIGGAVENCDRTTRLARMRLLGSLPSTRSGLLAKLSSSRGKTSNAAVSMIELESLTHIARRHGCSVNDAVLSTIAGALRGWLLASSQPLSTEDSFTVTMPLAVSAEDCEDALQATIATFVVQLPIGEPSAAMRTAHIARQSYVNASVREAVSAKTMVSSPDYLQPSLHALGIQSSARAVGYRCHGVVSNLPGPGEALQVMGQAVTSVVLVPPLLVPRGVSISVASYEDTVALCLVVDSYYGVQSSDFATHVAASVEQLRAI